MTKLGLFSLMGLYDRNTSPASVLRTTVDTVRMAEDLGFDVAWFAEHHFTNHSICPSSLLMVAHCATQVTRIRLGSAVLVLPFYDPLRLVQEAAFADLMARGRLVLGLGSGYQPYEFDRFGVDPETKTGIMMEAWDIIEQGLTSGFVDYRGEHFRIARTELSMRPFGLAMPEVFVAGSHADVMAREAPNISDALTTAILQGDAVIVQRLLDHGADALVSGNASATIGGATSDLGVVNLFNIVGGSTLTLTSTASGAFSQVFGANLPAGTTVGTVRINAVAGVPEPGTWMMMLLGFGAVGLTLRRRNRQLATA